MNTDRCVDRSPLFLSSESFNGKVDERGGTAKFVISKRVSKTSIENRIYTTCRHERRTAPFLRDKLLQPRATAALLRHVRITRPREGDDAFW